MKINVTKLYPIEDCDHIVGVYVDDIHDLWPHNIIYANDTDNTIIDKPFNYCPLCGVKLIKEG